MTDGEREKADRALGGESIECINTSMTEMVVHKKYMQGKRVLL